MTFTTSKESTMKLRNTVIAAAGLAMALGAAGAASAYTPAQYHAWHHWNASHPRPS
jgi:hypothetical protein